MARAEGIAVKFRNVKRLKQIGEVRVRVTLAVREHEYKYKGTFCRQKYGTHERRQLPI